MKQTKSITYERVANPVVPRSPSERRAELEAQIVEAADEILARYVDCEPLASILKTMPFADHCSIGTFIKILRTNPETAEAYEHAKEARAHGLVDSSLQYAREAALLGDVSGLKVAIDTNLKVASKLNKVEFGDAKQVELTGKDGGPVRLVALTDEQLMEIAARGAEQAPE